MNDNHFLIDPYRNPYLAVYLYEAGAQFEAVMNKYMITGRGVNPTNPRGIGMEGVTQNVSSAGWAFEDLAATRTIGAESLPTLGLPLTLHTEVAGSGIQ